MPNYKSLKTYSKTQKVVNYSTLFDKERYNFNSSSASDSTENNEQIVTKPSKKTKSAKKVIDKENIMPVNSRATRGKKNSEKIVDSLVGDQNQEDEAKINGKRKARINNTKATKKTEKSVKLFQMSNVETSSISQDEKSHDPKMDNTCHDIEEKMKDISIETNSKGVMTRGKRTLKACTSASNLKSNIRSTRAKADVINKENNPKVETKKGGIKKSKSTSNVLTAKKIQLVASDEKRTELVKEVSHIKSIMKSRTEDPDESTATKDQSISKKSTVPIKSKKAVKILETIDYKNDQISHLKIDNRTKHAAATSTPSGLRRKPLKAPQDISVIVTPNKK